MERYIGFLITISTVVMTAAAGTMVLLEGHTLVGVAVYLGAIFVGHNLYQREGN